MKNFKLTLVLVVFAICFVSCGGDDPDSGSFSNSGNDKSCESSSECPLGYTCDPEKKICTEESNNGDSENPSGNDSGDSGSGNNNGDGGDSSDSDTPSGDNGDSADDPDSDTGNQGPITGNCTPGDSQKCEYQGAPETEGVGPCKAAMRVCNDDGTWGRCEGEVLPVNEIGDELCSNGIDDDCNGVVDDGTDFDGDGHGACSDCCEMTETCPSPKDAWDPEKHDCTYSGGEIEENCDSEISVSSKNEMDYAKAIGLCRTTTEDSSQWGVISATISTPNDLTNKNVHEGSNGLLSKLGDVIKPKSGSFMLGLSSGKVKDPFESYEGSDTYTSGAPSDWLDAQNPKGSFPAAGSCSKSGTSGDVNDAVMFTLKIRTPPTAKSFSFNIYFLTYEYPRYICTEYNDFFIALLDSGYTSSDPNLKNPDDKNLAMDANGNPVGVNLAPAGLFTQCKKQSTVSNYLGATFDATSCTSTDELENTGFVEGSWIAKTYHGGTGWLTTRGNVKGGEIITLRLAIWDLSDHRLDSLVLIDNFKWETVEQKPGTGQY